MHAFGPGPWWVGGGQGLRDEQAVRTAWDDEAGGEEADADGDAVKIKKSIYSLVQTIGLVAKGRL